MKWYKFDEIPFPKGDYEDESSEFLALFKLSPSGSLYPYTVVFDYYRNCFVEASGEQYTRWPIESCVAWTTIEEVVNDYDFTTIMKIYGRIHKYNAKS